MFLKKLLEMTTKKEELVYTAKTYRMYDAVFEGKKATKLVLNQSVEPYVFLRKLKHDTIMSIYKLNIDKRVIVTERIFPFSTIFRRETKEFNRYIFLKIAKALEFLHIRCGIVHGNVVEEALFFGEDGRIVLGGFEKSRKGDIKDEDGMMFSNLVNGVLGIDTSLTHFIEQNGFCSDMFFELEITFFGYRSFTAERKLEFIADARKNSAKFIDIHKRRIAWMVLVDLSGDLPKEFKMSVVDFVLNFDLADIEEFVSPLFAVLDTNVRFHLLRNSRKYVNNMESLDPIIKTLLLGIKCKDKQMREETVGFIRENMNMISKKQQVEIVEVMCGYVSDDAGVVLVLEFLCTTKPVFKNSDVVYRILCRYLLQSGSKLQVLVALEMFYKTFDKFKMTTELLPLLCGYLSDKHIQMATFSLIEKILQHLKEHKNEIVDGEWRLGNIKSLFKVKPSEHVEGVLAKSAEKVSEPCRKQKQSSEASKCSSDDGWDDSW